MRSATGSRARSGAGRSDEGTTLIELMVAMGIFSILMVVVGAATLSLFSSIREATGRSQAQSETQNSMEWAARLLAYAQAPDEETPVMPEATRTSVTVYSYPGLGSVLDAPWKVRLSTVTSGRETSVVSDAWAPIRSGSSWTWTSTPRHRVLLTAPTVPNSSPLLLRYFVCTPSLGCTDSTEVNPNASGPLPIAASQTPATVLVSIGDPGRPNTVVTQSIRLVNLT